MLISNSQIITNLRRTASVGLISLLNQKQLEELALKYFSKYEDGKLVYICPYSGQPITDSKDIVLEHIIPVSSNGGTVLFNCIPTSKKVNGTDEKGARHLLSWWKQKEYYSPDKLDKLLSYMFEAYDTVFKEHTIEEVENSYNDIDLEEETITQEADLTTTRKEQAKRLKEQAEYTGVISYLAFINDCMSELKNNGYDITKYQEKLKQYEQNNIFKEIDRYTLIQETLRKVIKTKIEEDNRSELTYMLNINVSNLMQSIKGINTEEQIYNELLTRINNIENILEQNNIGIISFFEDAKNHDILYKYVSTINEEDINKVITEINLCVADKFIKMCEFVINNNGKLPKQRAEEEREKALGSFRNSIQKLQKNGKFATQLTKEQLKYLHDSEYEGLREIYKVILNKAIQNNIEIEYVDEEMKKRIEEFYAKNKDLSIEEQIKLEQEYKNVIIIESQFNEFINYVIKNNGSLPSSISKQTLEKTLGQFKNNVQRLKKNGKFATQLTKEQLKYLHDSNYENLREIYKVILNKAIQNNIELEYVDEEMKKRIEEFYTKNKDLSIEEQIKLEQEYKNVIIIESQFNEFIYFVKNNNGKLPSHESSKEEQEKRLGGFRKSVQVLQKNGEFATQLTKEQLKYLHDSEYEGLREIYKVILNKAIQNNIEIEYVDEEMKKRIEEFYAKNKDLSIEEQIKLEQEYKNVIIIESQFNEFIYFVKNNNGKLPSHESSKEEQEKRLGRFKSSVQVLQKNGKFATQLTKEQLKYLHDSEYEGLREIYKVILNKAIQNNIEIEYVDEYMKRKIKEFYTKNKDLSIEEQIELEQVYKDVITIESQFNEFINYVIKNDGKLPSQSSKEEKENKLGSYRGSIQQLTKKGKFNVQLTKEQLKYIHDSKYESLREIYKVILNKAIQNNIEIEYVDEEMKKRIEEFHSKNKGLSIEEQIELEQVYKDVIIIESQFNEFIDFVIKNDGKLPSTESKEEREQKLGRFKGSIKTLTKKGKFTTQLTKEQLEYLYNSKYSSLVELYNNIMEKAYSVNNKEYIDIDNEIRNENRKGRVA